MCKERNEAGWNELWNWNKLFFEVGPIALLFTFATSRVHRTRTRGESHIQIQRRTTYHTDQASSHNRHEHDCHYDWSDTTLGHH